MTPNTLAPAYTGGAVALRVILSAAIAVPIASLGALLAMRLSTLGTTGSADQWRDVPDLLVTILSASLPASLLGMLLVLPLIALAVGLGLFFRVSIARHLLAWCLAAPFVVCPVGIALLALLSRGGSTTPETFLGRFSEALFSSGGSFLLLATIPAAAAFYLLSRRAERRLEASIA